MDRLPQPSRGAPRRARLLASDPRFEALRAALRVKVNAVISHDFRDNIAEAARRSGVSTYALKRIMKGTADPKISTLCALGAAAGKGLYLFYEPDGLGVL